MFQEPITRAKWVLVAVSPTRRRRPERFASRCRHQLAQACQVILNGSRLRRSSREDEALSLRCKHQLTRLGPLTYAGACCHDLVRYSLMPET